MLATFKAPLPATFRINLDCAYADALREELASRFATPGVGADAGDLAGTDDAPDKTVAVVTGDEPETAAAAAAAAAALAAAPACGALPWYPGERAWQLGSADRRAIRSAKRYEARRVSFRFASFRFVPLRSASFRSVSFLRFFSSRSRFRSPCPRALCFFWFLPTPVRSCRWWTAGATRTNQTRRAWARRPFSSSVAGAPPVADGAQRVGRDHAAGGCLDGTAALPRRRAAPRRARHVRRARLEDEPAPRGSCVIVIVIIIITEEQQAAEERRSSSSGALISLDGAAYRATAYHRPWRFITPESPFNHPASPSICSSL